MFQILCVCLLCVLCVSVVRIGSHEIPRFVVSADAGGAVVVDGAGDGVAGGDPRRAGRGGQRLAASAAGPQLPPAAAVAGGAGAAARSVSVTVALFPEAQAHAGTGAE